MFHGNRDGCRILGICAVALGAGILMAFLLIACGCACCRR